MPNQGVQFHRRTEFSFSNIPLAIRIAALCVGLCALLAGGLTAISYSQASRGLHEQGQAAIRSDAQFVAGALDSWHAQRLRDLQVLANLPNIQTYAAMDPTTRAQMSGTIEATLQGVDTKGTGVESIGIMDAEGTIVLSTDPNDVGLNVPTRDYFQEAIHGKAFVSGVSISTSTNAPAVYHSVPIRDASGAPIGVIRTRSALGVVQSVVAAARGRVGAEAEGVLLDQNGLVIAGGAADWLLRPVVPLGKTTLDALVQAKRWGKETAPSPLGQTDLGRAVGAQAPIGLDWNRGGTPFDAFAYPLAQTTWTYVAALPQSTSRAAADTLLEQAVAGALAALVLVSVLAFLATRGIGRAVGEVASTATRIASTDLPSFVRVARALASGDLGERAEVTSRRLEIRSGDELGRMSADFNAMLAGLADLQTAFVQAGTGLSGLVGRVQIASGTLSQVSRDLGANAEQTDEVTRQLGGTIAGLSLGAQEQATAAGRASLGAIDLAHGLDAVVASADSQAGAVRTAVDITGRMADRVGEVAGRAALVAAASQETRVAAEDGAGAVRDAVSSIDQLARVVAAISTKVERLGSLGERVGEIVETIDEIADQTSLLALNAAIEAARAGQHGRSFAVVASEVRKLAERSRLETSTISGLVRGIQSATQETIESIEAGSTVADSGLARAARAGEALARILTAVEATTEQVGDIAQSARELGSGSREVTTAMASVAANASSTRTAADQMRGRAAEMSDRIREIAAITEEHSAATEEVSAAAAEIATRTEGLRGDSQMLAGLAAELRAAVSGFQIIESARHQGA